MDINESDNFVPNHVMSTTLNAFFIILDDSLDKSEMRDFTPFGRIEEPTMMQC